MRWNKSIYVCILISIIGMISCNTYRILDGKQLHEYSTCQIHWGNEFCSHINQLSFGSVYVLNPVAENGNHILAGFVVEKNVGILKKRQCRFLKKALCNSSCYDNDTSQILKTFFAPYLAIELKNAGKAQYLLLCYSSKEWALATENKIIKKCRLANLSNFVDFGMEILRNDQYLEDVKITTIKNH